ncbi:MAG: Wzz/FepE/Etk N-terminal domain-containing protein [Desulfobacteraceae bacterium]|nr:Wzz/FepE/Etk N-terminal domain-containing protein [Desulfobacteraceae bacterium]
MSEPQFKITPEVAIDIILRRRWVILIPFSLALIIGIYMAVTLPRVYEAKTMILVEGQRVPQNYVQSIVTEDTAQRIATISQQIMSRTNLERIIREYNLFADPKLEKMFIEDKVSNLRKRIKVDVVNANRQTEAFTITFKDTEPERVMRVANGLASYFIDENLKVRESQATGTSTFLESELETMRLRLEHLEESIKNYRKTNMGELPEQLETNLRILERLQADLTGRQQSLRDARSRLGELNTQATSREPSVVVIGGQQRSNEGSASLEELRSQLESLQSRYTEKHPDIQRLKAQIADLEAIAVESAKQNGDSGGASRIPLQLRQQIAEAKREIQLAESEIDQLRAQIAVYQDRVENIPKREQELLGLRRDYENIKTTYESLLTRKMEADIAVNMERKQKGEQFRIVDPAQIPQRPIEPDLRKLLLFALVGGIGLGAGVALLMEFVAPTYRKPAEIEAQFEIPVLVSIPQLLQPKQLLLKKINFAASIAYTVGVFGLLGLFGYISLAAPQATIEAFKKILGS